MFELAIQFHEFSFFVRNVNIMQVLESLKKLSQWNFTSHVHVEMLNWKIKVIDAFIKKTAV